MTTHLQKLLNGQLMERPPIWMMRQAGRYLPEYRKIRSTVSGFLELCYTPELAKEVTLQPLKRFPFDAAIIFSDILVIPDALGQHVTFIEGEGPKLTPIDLDKPIQLSQDNLEKHLEPVYEAIRLTRQQLDNSISLIGFCGAPWTIATYMIAGRGGNNLSDIRHTLYKNTQAFDQIIETLVESCIKHLSAQIDAGADIVQIFDSWAASLDTLTFKKYGIDPVKKIIKGVRAKHPQAKIIVFPRGIFSGFDQFIYNGGADAIGIDWSADILKIRNDLGSSITLQGNLDPARLIAGGKALEEGINSILSAMNNTPHIFNLGHGIDKTTPIAHVEQMVELVHNYDNQAL